VSKEEYLYVRFDLLKPRKENLQDVIYIIEGIILSILKIRQFCIKEVTKVDLEIKIED